jgi:large subunit ribosomal protein L5
MNMNPMREIRLAKVTVNMGAGESGPKLEKAKKMMEVITEKRVVLTYTKKRSTFGVPKNRPIGAKTTLRGNEAMVFLKRVLHAAENRLKQSQFDDNGNFSFGIQESIRIPGVKYDPDIGIVGLDVCVTLERPGYRVKRRALRPAKIGKAHVIKKEEAMEWAKKNLGVTIE